MSLESVAGKCEKWIGRPYAGRSYVGKFCVVTSYVGRSYVGKFCVVTSYVGRSYVGRAYVGG